MIVICDRCLGVGTVEFDVGTHKSQYEQEQCEKCGGSGRIIKTSTSEPFTVEKIRATRLH